MNGAIAPPGGGLPKRRGRLAGAADQGARRAAAIIALLPGWWPRKRQRRTTAIASCLAVAAVLAACGTGRDAVDPTSAGQYRFVNATAAGTVIPAAARKPVGPLTGTLIGGGGYQLSAHKGHVVLINYWASWCAPCVTESPMLNTVARAMKDRGVDFVGIDVKDERQAAQSFITDNHMSYPMVYDESAKTALQLAIPAGGLPVTILVDRAGRVAAVYLGAVRQPDVSATVRQLAAERP